MFSANVLLYGDYPDLAARCLKSIATSKRAGLVREIRVGLNAVGERTAGLVAAFLESCPVRCHVFKERHGRNVHKYPMMRRMLYDPELELAPGATHVVWFDDDSFLLEDLNDEDCGVTHSARSFWERLADQVSRSQSQVIGSVYFPGYHWNEHEQAAIKAQPWYRGVGLTTKPKFVTGGWWVADYGFLRTWDYPFKELRHNGGDVILGELLRQRGLEPHHFRTGVAINADPGGAESKAPRRGDTTPRPFEKPPPYDYSHHDFEVDVRTKR